jgi:hypothetical protein
VTTSAMSSLSTDTTTKEKLNNRIHCVLLFLMRLEPMCRGHGCQIFLDTRYQNGENVTNDHNIYQIAITWCKWLQCVPNCHKISHSKAFQNLVFWCENIPSGNPGVDSRCSSGRMGKLLNIALENVAMSAWHYGQRMSNGNRWFKFESRQD